jgi:hypothetical protein
VRDVVAYMEDELRTSTRPRTSSILHVNRTSPRRAREGLPVRLLLPRRTQSRKVRRPSMVGETGVLARFGSRTDLPHPSDWLAAKLQDPRSFAQGLRMSFGRDEDEDASHPPRRRKAGPGAHRFMPVATPALLPEVRSELSGPLPLPERHQIGDRGETSTAPLTREGSMGRDRRRLPRSVLLAQPVLEERMPVFRMPISGGSRGRARGLRSDPSILRIRSAVLFPRRPHRGAAAVRR